MRVTHGINLTQLRAFVAVVDNGGFGSAAAALGLTQSAVSHAVAALERTVGSQVLHRAGDGPKTTTFGARMLEHARAALAATEAIGDLSAAQHGAPHGVVRVAAPPTVCQGLLPELVAGWRTEFPRVTVRVFEGEEDEVDDWLAGHSVEAAVLVDPPVSAPGALIATDEFHALLPTGHRLAGEASLRLTDLEKDPLLFSGGSCERPIEDLFRQAGVRLRPTHQVRELGTLFAMVRSQMGIAILPSLVRSFIGQGLVLIPLDPTHRRRLVLTGPPGTPWHPAVSVLMDSAGTQPR
jgi:DNA-binding transcriptional LysR family regulator